MRADPRSRQRKTIRLPGRDYRADGLYYVTIVCEGRRPVLSEVREGHIALSPIGEIVTECWLAVPNLRTCHTCERRYRTHPIVYPGQPGAVAKIATQHMKSVGAKHPPLARGTLERNGGCFARAHATPRAPPARPATRDTRHATRDATPAPAPTPRDTRCHATRHATRPRRHGSGRSIRSYGWACVDPVADASPLHWFRHIVYNEQLNCGSGTIYGAGDPSNGMTNPRFRPHLMQPLSSS